MQNKYKPDISSHIFKRLKWMNNKYLSHVGTLLFLAVWHGYHLGYFLLFAFEFMCMMAQEQVNCPLHFFLIM